MEHCLQAMLTKLFLGFGLDLYDEAEIHMIYWYADYLYGLRIYNMNELQNAKEQQVEKARPKGRPKAQPKGGQRPRNPTPFLLLLEAAQHSVRGLFRLLTFCLQRGYISSSPAILEGMPQRFVLRFRSLEHFRLPHLPSYRDFQASADSGQSPTDSRVVLEAAQSSFCEANQFLEKLGSAVAKEPIGDSNLVGLSQDSVKGMKKMIVANQLAIKQLEGALNRSQTVKVTTSAAYHPYLLAVQVVPSG